MSILTTQRKIMLDTPLISLFQHNKAGHHLYCTDKNHILVDCNFQQAIDLGYESKEEVIGKSLFDLCKNVNSIISNNELIFKKNNTLGEYFNELLGDTIKISYSSYKAICKDSKGKIIGLMGISIPTPEKPMFSTQQKNCLDLLLQGLSPKQIALDMQLSYKTIEHYLAHIRAKMHCKTTRELILKLK